MKKTKKQVKAVVKKVHEKLTKKYAKKLPPMKATYTQQELPMKVTPAKPTLEQLSAKAAEHLAPTRRQIEKAAQAEYEAAKFAYVKSYAEAEGLKDKFIVATITPKEEIKVKP